MLLQMSKGHLKGYKCITITHYTAAKKRLLLSWTEMLVHSGGQAYVICLLKMGRTLYLCTVLSRDENHIAIPALKMHYLNIEQEDEHKENGNGMGRDWNKQ